MSRVFRIVVASLALLGASPSIAAAAKDDPEAGDVALRPRVFFDLDMLYWRGTLYAPGPAGGLLVRTEAVGVLGYRQVPIGFGAAMALSERVLVGGRIDAAAEPATRGVVRVRGAISPFAQLFFARNRNVRPFALVRLGIGRSHAFDYDEEAKAIRGVGPLTWYPTFGAGLGAHVFINDEVSFDAMLAVDHRWNFERPIGEGDANVSESTVTPTTWHYRDGTLSTALTFGFSNWF